MTAEFPESVDDEFAIEEYMETEDVVDINENYISEQPIVLENIQLVPPNSATINLYNDNNAMNTIYSLWDEANNNLLNVGPYAHESPIINQNDIDTVIDNLQSHDPQNTTENNNSEEIENQENLDELLELLIFEQEILGTDENLDQLVAEIFPEYNQGSDQVFTFVFVVIFTV